MHLIDYDNFNSTSCYFMLLPPKTPFCFIVTLFMICISLVLISIFAPIDDIIKVSVILRPLNPISSVRCVQEGEISQKQYYNGQLINEGDFLFCLDTKVDSLELENAKIQLNQLNQDLLVQKTLLDTIRLNILPAETENSEEYLRSKSFYYEQEYYQVLIKELELKLSRESEKPSSLSVLQNFQDITSNYNKAILQYNSWRSTQNLVALDQYKSIEREKNLLLNHISELERKIKNATIFAPIQGRIIEKKQMNIGDYIIAGEEIIRIVPENASSLKAELYIDTSQIARINLGSEVKIRFPGLPPSRYGQIITRVSLLPPDFSYKEPGVPIFIAEAELSEPWLVSKNGERINLLPGISAEGRIVIEKTTLLRVILRKLDFIN